MGRQEEEWLEGWQVTATRKEGYQVVR
jgi:hypothetical protein